MAERTSISVRFSPRGREIAEQAMQQYERLHAGDHQLRNPRVVEITETEDGKVNVQIIADYFPVVPINNMEIHLTV